MRYKDLLRVTGDVECKEFEADHVNHTDLLEREVILFDFVGGVMRVYLSPDVGYACSVTVRELYEKLPVYISTVLNNKDDDLEDDEYLNCLVDGIWFYKSALMIDLKEA